MSTAIVIFDMSDLGDAEDDEDDGLGDLLDEEEEDSIPTIDDLKAAFKGVVVAKGKDEGTAFVKKVMNKMKVKGMKDIADDKREAER